MEIKELALGKIFVTHHFHRLQLPYLDAWDDENAQISKYSESQFRHTQNESGSYLYEVKMPSINTVRALSEVRVQKEKQTDP